MVIVTADSVYWFFSTVAQCLAAIIGFSGKAAFYKLQLMENSLKDTLLESKVSLNQNLNVPTCKTSDLRYKGLCYEKSLVSR